MALASQIMAFGEYCFRGYRGCYDTPMDDELAFSEIDTLNQLVRQHQ